MHTTIEKCKHLTWHISHDLCFKRKLLNTQKKKKNIFYELNYQKKIKSSKDHNTIESL
jgi:hypothetical protein